MKTFIPKKKSFLLHKLQQLKTNEVQMLKKESNSQGKMSVCDRDTWKYSIEVAVVGALKPHEKAWFVTCKS